MRIFNRIRQWFVAKMVELAAWRDSMLDSF